MTTLLPRELANTVATDAGSPMSRGTGRAVLTGNELIVKGALEAGVSLVTGYPGSPVAEVFIVCERHGAYLAELGVEASLADNEAQSAAMLNGARQVPGARSIAIMKSVGAYVALDGLAIANAARPADGAAAVVVVGDDPPLSSTQVGADSRLTLAAGRIPVIEPATVAGIKDAVAVAFDLSEESGLIVAVLVTTSQADGLAVADLAPNLPPRVGPRRRVRIDTSAIDVDRAVSLPPRAAILEGDLLGRRVPLLTHAVRRRRLDQTEGPTGGRLGVITAGASYVLVRDALANLGADGALPLLRLTLTWPADEEAIADFARHVDEIVVVEERAPHLEDQVRRAVANTGVPVFGKQFPAGAAGFPEAGGLTPDIVRARFATLVGLRPPAFPAVSLDRARTIRVTTAPIAEASTVLARTPTYCAGCPHRGTSSPLIEVRRRLSDPDHMRREHGREPVDVIAHGGIGCYSMAFLPPWKEMHNLSAMGLGGATGAGYAPLTDNRHYVLVGDGTFFHGEMATMANSVKQRQDILYIVLDNKTTAMTGHQGTPGSARDLMGRPQQPVDIERIVRAMGPGFVQRVNPDERDDYTDLLERVMLMEGTRVIIADKECAITKGRRDKADRARDVARVGFEPVRVLINIAEDVCENCRECTRATACPGLTIVDTPLGEKVAIDRDVCVDDAYCTKVKACPSFEQVTVRRTRAPAPAAEPEPLTLTEPTLPEVRPSFSIEVPGVGGMGTGVAARVLIEAAAAEWPAVEAFQKKGLAQRGGSVFAQIVMHDGTRPRPASVAHGELDLVIGLEPLEALRSLGAADHDRVAAVVDASPRPTTTMLTGADDRITGFDEKVREHTRPGGAAVLKIGDACERTFGRRVATNIAAIGVAYQCGYLPLSGEGLRKAIEHVSGRRHAATNLAAFELGRGLAARERHEPGARSLAEVIDDEAKMIRSRREGRAYGSMMGSMDGISEAVARAVAVRLPDLLAWGGEDYGRRYLDAVAMVADRAPDLAVAVAHNLHRVMAIKDEVFVAHLLTSQKKYARDRERFGIDELAGDRLAYVHFNRASFGLFGRQVEFDLQTRDWMLRIIRMGRPLRRLAPGWHRRERAFRDWYAETVIPLVTSGSLSGDAALEAVRLPETVTGFREIRYPKEDRAVDRFAEIHRASSIQGGGK